MIIHLNKHFSDNKSKIEHISFTKVPSIAELEYKVTEGFPFVWFVVCCCFVDSVLSVLIKTLTVQPFG